MSLNVYQIDDWVAFNNYFQNDIVRYNNLFYYLSSKQLVPSVFSPDVDTSNWVGYKIATDGTLRPSFSWLPSYNFSNDFSPTIKKIAFGDGYTQRIPQEVNNNLLNLNLTFEGRKTKEARAIVHFLNQRQGSESFLYTPPGILSFQKLFTAEKYKLLNISYDNYTISVNFIEVPV